MSRSGYSDGLNDWSSICWRGAVASAIRGARGQAFLKALLGSLLALKEKKLIAHELELDGQVCALGAIGRDRGIDMSKLYVEDYDAVASAFGVAAALTREIAYENDEGSCYNETDEGRYKRMCDWVRRHIDAGRD